MSSYAVVSSKSELERALERKVDSIVITDSDLAGRVRTVKTASRAALVAAIAAVGVAAVNFWNPIGWGVGFVGLTTGSTIVIALAVLGLGATLIWALYNDYNITAGGKVTLPDGTVVEGELVLKKG